MGSYWQAPPPKMAKVVLENPLPPMVAATRGAVFEAEVALGRLVEALSEPPSTLCRQIVRNWYLQAVHAARSASSNLKDLQSALPFQLAEELEQTARDVTELVHTLALLTFDDELTDLHLDFARHLRSAFGQTSSARSAALQCVAEGCDGQVRIKLRPRPPRTSSNSRMLS